MYDHLKLKIPWKLLGINARRLFTSSYSGRHADRWQFIMAGSWFVVSNFIEQQCPNYVRITKTKPTYFNDCFVYIYFDLKCIFHSIAKYDNRATLFLCDFISYLSKWLILIAAVGWHPPEPKRECFHMKQQFFLKNT